MNTETASPEGLKFANGRYHVQHKLGEGGMATVYKARDENLEAEVVIKIPKATLLADPEYAQRFTRERRALVNLKHPYVVTVTDVGEHEGIPYVVMQYLTGGSLQDQVPAKDGTGAIGPWAALPCWLTKVASALDFIHQQGYVHRDIKPANILFDGHGNAYLSDFGIAKALATDLDSQANVSLTGTGVVLGTPAYMAPEFVMGMPYDGRIDQYALAVTVYEILAQHTPFEATTPGAMLVKQTTEAAKPLSDLVPGISRELSRAVQKGLEKEPKNRFQSCSAFAEAVLRGYGGMPATAPHVSSSMRPTDAPVSQQTVAHGSASPSKQMPAQRFTPAAPRGGPTPLRVGAPLPGTRLSGSQVTRTAPLTRAHRPSNKAPLIMGGAVVVAALAAAAFFFLKSSEDKEPSSGGVSKPDVTSKQPSKGGTPSTPVAGPSVPEELAKHEIRRFEGHKGEIRCLAVSSDGRMMLTGSLDHTARLWDVESGQERANVPMDGATDTPLALAFSPGNPGRILIGGSRTVQIYDLTSKSVIKSIKLPGADALAFLPDGKRFCVATDRWLEIWDLERGERAGRLSDDPVPQVRSLFASQDGRFIVSGHGSGNVGSKSPPEFSIVLWDANSGKRLKTFEGHKDDVTAVAVAPDGNRLLSCGLEGSFRLWDVNKASVLHEYDFPRGITMPALRDENGNVKLRMGVAFSPESNKALLGAPGAVSYEDVVNWSNLLSLKGHKNELIECVAFSPDGSKAFSAGGDKVIRLWNLN